jgi:hypothetical protein
MFINRWVWWYTLIIFKVQDSPGIKARLYSKSNLAKRAGSMGQMVESLPSNCETLRVQTPVKEREREREHTKNAGVGIFKNQGKCKTK